MNRRLLIGVVLLLVAAGLVAAWQFIPKPDTRPVETVTGYFGSEKAGFLADPDVQRILSERYRLQVDAASLGSLDQIKADSTGKDFLWPSNESALELYKQQHGGVTKSQVIFNSPIVFYSWDVVADALVSKNIVQPEGSIYYVNDVPALVKQLSDGKTTWKDLGLNDLYGNFAIISSDPTKSNSGNMFAALLASMLLQGQVPDENSIESVLPDVKNYFTRLGFLEPGSGDIFKRFIVSGVGDKPIIVGYESQLIEFSIENAANRDEILKRIRIIYPRPTEWSAHPIIALTPKGETLMKALQDPELQKIAWEKHGFRSDLIGIANDPQVLSVVGIPETIKSVIPLPRPQVLERLIQYLGQ